MKKSKYILGVLLSLAVLGGCREEMPSLGTASSEETSESTGASTDVTTAVPAKNVTETSTTSEKSENYKMAERTVLENHIKKAADEDVLENPIFDDLDGDGSLELIAICNYDWWYTNGKNTQKLKHSGYDLSIIEAEGQKIAALGSAMYIFKDSNVEELDISGHFFRIEKTGDNLFEAIAPADDGDLMGEHTEKIYWLYFENGQFKEYVGKKITKSDFINYGGKSALEGIEGEVTDILHRENGVVNVNYTVKEDGTVCNKYKTYDVTDGCKEIAAGDGIYLPSTLDPFLGLSEEQLALHKLIIDTSENKEGKIFSPLFGDFDSDGVNEVIAILGGEGEFGSFGEVWFASGNKAECIAKKSDWLRPQIVSSCGRTYIKMENCAYITSSISYYFMLRDSSASVCSGIPRGQGVYPDGAFGDFNAVHDAYDGSIEWDKSDKDSTPIGMGHTWKSHWYYMEEGEAHYYRGRLISEEEFLKYEGAKAALDSIAAEGYTVDSIIKRGCGIITLTYIKVTDTEDYFYQINNYKIFKYRNGVVADVTNYGEGPYTLFEDLEYSDFERFSEMIYDTAEGDENSVIRERFYGNINGKNALYAYYGTDENFSLWYADKDGAKKVTEDISLFYADGDALMRNGGDYFVMKNGKPQKLDTMGAEDFTMLPDGSFTGIVKSGYSDSQKTEETKKPYWFRYRDGAFSDCIGVDITEEELLQYGGGRAALDEVAARGGDLVNIVRRENGIININYALHNQTTTKRFFMTLEIDDDNKLTDITPKKEDGTPDNAGWYLHSLEIRG